MIKHLIQTKFCISKKVRLRNKCYLSAIAPDTIVVAVVANDNWKRKLTKMFPMLSEI